MNKRCPRCLTLVHVSDWKPPRGMDNLLRRFYCSHCDYEWYDRLTYRQLVKLSISEGGS